MRIVVVGAPGKAAPLLAPLLPARGDAGRPVNRNPDPATAGAASGATPGLPAGETLATGASGALLAGHDAVVWSAGAGGLGGGIGPRLAEAAGVTLERCVAGVRGWVGPLVRGSRRGGGRAPAGWPSGAAR